MKEEQTNGANAPANHNSEQVVENKESVENSDPVTKEELNEEQVAESESEIEKLTRDLSEVQEKHLRLYSEFENYRRRTAKERLEMISSANANLIESLLPVLDDFERAMEAGENSESGTEHLGINLIYQKLLKELQNKGLKPMEGLVGQPFDAEVHEAISQTPAPKKKLKNRIVHVVEKGYYLNDKVLRYAKVVIGT
jgi:molecular chaperone GrpE